MKTTVLTFILTLLVSLLGVASSAPASSTEPGLIPYYAPPFGGDCTVHRFGEGVAPDLTGYPDDPLCVEYAKRNITVDNGGALGFLLAEPARLALVADKCAYWQQDHWSIQLSRRSVPIIRWDGSYWFDLGKGQAGARLTDLRILGQPATIARAAAFIAPFSPALAAYLLRYGRGGDGGAVDLGVPLVPRCAV